MSAPWELNNQDDSVILTVDVADSPIAELRLSEIYDVKTSSMNDDYIVVLHNYIALQLKTTVGLCDRSIIHLLGSRFIPLHCRANGDIVSLRKPAMERLIQQTLQSRLDTCSPVSVSILIQFKTPGFRIPRRLHESLCFPPKIGGVERDNNDVITALPAGVREDSQHTFPCLLQHLAGNKPTVGGIPLTDSTMVDSFVTLEPVPCLLFRIYPPVYYPGNVIDCPTASEGDAALDSARTADNSLDVTANEGETVTPLNDFIESANDHTSETVKYPPVDRGRLLLDTSRLAPSSTSTRVVANNPICVRTTNSTLPGITTPQAGIACNTDNRLVRRNEHVVNTKFAPLASTWLPILLRYQPVDRGRCHLLHQTATFSTRLY
ncbi:hypothetical protein MHU86_13141 [Fragilaria crotonensis]|nr:hypothetical protein MHU86_13141 [Fragilaria crotonensis]